MREPGELEDLTLLENMLDQKLKEEAPMQAPPDKEPRSFEEKMEQHYPPIKIEPGARRRNKEGNWGCRDFWSKDFLCPEPRLRGKE